MYCKLPKVDRDKAQSAMSVAAESRLHDSNDDATKISHTHVSLPPSDQLRQTDGCCVRESLTLFRDMCKISRKRKTVHSTNI